MCFANPGVFFRYTGQTHSELGGPYDDDELDKLRPLVQYQARTLVFLFCCHSKIIVVQFRLSNGHLVVHTT